MLSVLLVCTGNICRSPMAEGFLTDRSRRLGRGEIAVESAGTWARSGSPPMPEAVEVAAERGVDIEDLQSEPVSRAALSRADLILTMTAEQREEILHMDGSAESRTFTLKELVRLLAALPAPEGEDPQARIAQADHPRRGPDAPVIEDEDIRDPLGMGMDTYRAVAWEIETYIDDLMKGMLGTGRAASSPSRDRED